ncbi:hypothetical protein CCACVL1_26437 [Corchorus capsularis]|uniref:Uncharacterized protein n=1 Tax=Corchorus capsularis TaxID=210143 RepID=A0A1R3GEU0_COCAP|nr:hypothetical protein CCACVL1_26437 [Corchorus capsularis]
MAHISFSKALPFLSTKGKVRSFPTIIPPPSI